ncbi:MAG: insulinase family protein, partial [Candidatus Marinimicrobia bacterium]|nr:insulinase family protein [Candidatus Neomarinimicrobiota bacterium]
YLKGGSVYMGKERAGIEPLLMSTAVHGTETWNQAELAPHMDSFGFDFKIESTYDYSGLTASFKATDLERAWSLFSDIILHPRLDPTAVELERKRLLTSLEQAGLQNESEADRLAIGLFYKRHSYSHNPRGSKRTIADFTRRDLIQYQHGDIAKNRALLVVIGDLDIKELTIRCRSLAKQMPLGPELLPSSLTFDPGEPELRATRRSGRYTYVTGLCPAPRPGHAEYPAFLMAMDVLRDGLQLELTEQRIDAIELTAGVGFNFFNHGYIRLISRRPDDVIRKVYDLVDKLIDDPLPEERVAGLGRAAVIRHYLQRESSGGHLRQLARWELVGDGWEQADQFPEEPGLVRPEQIQHVLRKYFKKLHFGAVGNPANISRRLFTSR